MIQKKGKILKLIVVTLAVFMAVPVQTIWAAPGKLTTKIKHKPPKKEYIPGFRIQLDAKIKDKAGLLATRCYFKAKKDKVFTFINMNDIGNNEYRGILPAPWVNSEFIEYVFVTVNKIKQVTRTQIFKIEEAETKEAAQWKDAGQVKELRIDKAQEVVEEYETLRKNIRKHHRRDRPKYQIESEDVMTVMTEVDDSLVSLNGFYDGITLSQVPASASYGALTEGIYTAEQAAATGGAASATAATGATAAGAIEASTGMSTAAVVGIGVGAAAIIGGGVAAGVALSDSNDDGDDDHHDNHSHQPPTNYHDPVDVGNATELHFVGTYSNRDPNRPASEWHARTTLNKGGSGSWEEWTTLGHNNGNLKWYWNRSNRHMIIDYLTGASFSGTVTGNTHNFSLSGHWGNGTPGTIIFTRQ